MLEKTIEEVINHVKQIHLKVKTPPEISLRNSSIRGELRTEYAAGIHIRLWCQPAAFSTSHHMWCTCETKNMKMLDEFGRIYMFPGNVKLARKGTMSVRNKSNQRSSNLTKTINTSQTRLQSSGWAHPLTSWAIIPVEVTRLDNSITSNVMPNRFWFSKRLILLFISNDHHGKRSPLPLWTQLARNPRVCLLNRYSLSFPWTIIYYLI